MFTSQTSVTRCKSLSVLGIHGTQTKVRCLWARVYTRLARKSVRWWHNVRWKILIKAVVLFPLIPGDNLCSAPPTRSDLFDKAGELKWKHLARRAFTHKSDRALRETVPTGFACASYFECFERLMAHSGIWRSNVENGFPLKPCKLATGKHKCSQFTWDFLHHDIRAVSKFGWRLFL